MAIGSDVVQPIKQESASLGGQDPASDAIPLQLPIQYDEDALECAGIVLQALGETRDKTVWAERHNGEWRMRDQKNTDRPSLTDLRQNFAMNFLLMGA